MCNYILKQVYMFTCFNDLQRFCSDKKVCSRKELGFNFFVLLVTAVNGMPAWTPYVSSELLPQYGLAVMRSNRWPGAVAFAKDR